MDNIFYSIGTGIVILAFVVGLLGTVLPVIPGLIVIWLGALNYAAVDVGFDAVTDEYDRARISRKGDAMVEPVEAKAADSEPEAVMDEDEII